MHRNPLRVAGCPQDGIAQSRGRAVDDFHRGDSLNRRIGELVDQRGLCRYLQHSEDRSLYRPAAKNYGHLSHNVSAREHFSAQAYSHPLARAIRAASTRFEAPSLLIASDR